MSERTTSSAPDGASSGSSAVARKEGAPDPKQNGNRSAEQIEADLAQTRERLATTIDAIVARVHPKTLMQEGKTGAKGLVIDPESGLRTGRIAAVVGTVAAVAGLFVLARKRSRGRD